MFNYRFVEQSIELKATKQIYTHFVSILQNHALSLSLSIPLSVEWDNSNEGFFGTIRCYTPLALWLLPYAFVWDAQMNWIIYG